VYDAFARSLKRFRVVITIDLRLFARRKSRVDAQNRVSLKIAFDSNSVEKKKKKVKKKKKTTKKIAKKKKNEKNEKEKKKNENDEIDDDDEKNDDVDVRAVQIAVNKQLKVQIFVIIDKRSSRFVKK
jgi:mannitol-specific phosphotransferase system IIBC component